MTANGDSATQTGIDAETDSRAWIERLRKEADGNDLRLLELLHEHRGVATRHVGRLIAERDEALLRLRAAGVSNIEISEHAGVSDSGLSRRAIQAGASRRVNRRTGPPDRRAGTEEPPGGTP